MSTIFRDITSVDKMPSHIETQSRIFGRPFGKIGFRSRRLSQDCNMFPMQMGSRSIIENMSEERSRVAAVRSTTLGLQSRLNEDLIINDHGTKSTASRTFGLQSRISSSVAPLHLEDSLRLNQMADNAHQRNNTSTISRTFGLVPEDMNSLSLHNSERLNQEFRENNVDLSVMSRPLGLQTRNVPPHSHLFSQDNFTVNQGTNNSATNYRRNNINISTISRTSGLNSENMNGLNLHDNGGFSKDSRRNLSYTYNLQSRNMSLHPSLFSEGNLRLNHDSNHRNNNLGTVSKTFGPAVRSTTLTTGIQMQDSLKYNDDRIDNSGFRRPNISRVIRGRNSTLSSRLFHNQNMTRHCKDLSNINGFNVSHISRRDMDTLSESRFALNMRNNCVDNQSIAGSVLSMTSVKSQFLNLLESLHHSILNIGPNVTAEAVRMEFDRAKQRLENISEMSFAPSIHEAGATSVILQSSKYICPQINEPVMTNTIDGGSLHLKSSKDLLKSLIPKKNNYKSKCNSSAFAEEKEEGQEERGRACDAASQKKSELNDEQNSDLLFKKPRSYIKKKKSPRMMKIKAPQVVKSLTSKASNKMINLKQWFPIAVGSDLAFCGVDDEGASVKTDAVKKRLNNRKIELVNGTSCNLIGSPSATVSVLPRKIVGLLKNGLTDRWRVLQKELLNCQTAEEETEKRKSKSPKVKNSPEKKKMETPKKRTKNGKFKSPKVISTPKNKGKGMLTRSGRAVKPPTMFWLATGSNAVTSSPPQPTYETTPSKVLSKKKSKKTPVNNSKKSTPPSKKTPADNSKKSTPPSKKTPADNSKKNTPPWKKKSKANEKSPNKKAKDVNDSSPKKRKKKDEEFPSGTTKASGGFSPPTKKATDEPFKKPKQKPSKLKSPKVNKKKESEEIVKVHSSAGDAKLQTKTRQTHGKRKREATADSYSVHAKKTKLEKKVEVTAESTVETVERINKRGKKKTNKLSLIGSSPKTKRMKSPSMRGRKKTVKKKGAASESVSESKKEAKELTEFEEDFEFKLDDIEIPEIANVSGNPQLSRSQLRLVSMETPPLKYFNNNLKLLRSATPVRSPDWCISQRTESEVKQFQRRREEAFRKKISVDVKKTIITEKTKNVQSKDVKRVMEWVAEKTVRSPQWNSKLLQYVLPSRKRMEQQDDEEEEEEEEVNIETRFL